MAVRSVKFGEQLQMSARQLDIWSDQPPTIPMVFEFLFIKSYYL
jgi:hypothetical protein